MVDLIEKINQQMAKDFGLDTYQDNAIEYAFYEGTTYPVLGLVGEAGEIAEKWKKLIRDQDMPAGHEVRPDDPYMDDELREDIILELGDLLFYIANLADDLDYSLAEVAEMNLKKLEGRLKRGTLQGSGDHR